MRPEQMEKVAPVAYVIGELVMFLSEFDAGGSELRAEVELKRQERMAEQFIRDFQKSSYPNKDGYYISTGIVYKVYHNNTVVKKITGDEAKTVKRMVKKAADNRAIEKTAKPQSAALDEHFALMA